jgi:hemolysin activation/secretion protein
MIGAAGLGWAQSSPGPDFAALEAAGARVGEIRILTENIFDPDDPKEDRWLFRAANRLHVRTRPEVIRRALLFRTGEPVPTRRIEETERLLRANPYLYDVEFRAVPAADGAVDIEVVTRDTWSLDVGLVAGRSGGASTSGWTVREYNVLGTGTSLGVERRRDVDRTSDEISFANDSLLGSRTGVSFRHASNSDGRRDEAAVQRSFRALDDRWASGVRGLQDDRIESVYAGGRMQSQYRRLERRGEVFGGWSDGLVGGWARRTSVGLMLQEDRYSIEPGAIAPSALPPDQKLVAPFLRLAWLEDRFERDVNRNLIGQPEFFALGTTATFQVGLSMPALGSSQRSLLYQASLSRGFQPDGADRLIVAANVGGQFEEDRVRRGRLGLLAQYYRPQSTHRLFYASATVESLQRPDPAGVLLIGGDNGLRGYPLRYQSGNRRALFTLEQRFYTDLFVWQLFRIGGAVFADAGRAWGGVEPNPLNPGWLADAGLGLRIVNARSAFSNVLHVDLAFPFNTAPGIKRAQFNVKAKASF